MKNKNLKYLIIAIATGAVILIATLPNKRPVTHLVNNNAAERHAKR